MMRLFPSPRTIQQATENVVDRVLNGRLADVTPLAQTTILDEPQCLVVRFDQGKTAGQPVLFVPPLAAPAFVFDMRRGCSFAEYMVEQGFDTYLVDYGAIGFEQRHLGLEHWIGEIIPKAVRAVSKRSKGRPVHLVAWSLGGALAGLAIADDKELPVASLTMVATPIDADEVPLISLAKPFVELTGGVFGTTAYRILGTAPGPIVKRFYQLATFDKFITKPLAIARNLPDRDSLEQIEAVDRIMDSMTAFSGRALGQIYHDIVRTNEMADGKISFGDHEIDMRDVHVPVLAVAGTDDVLAPVDAVHHVKRFIPQAELFATSGGHLGLLAGRGAVDSTWPAVSAFISRRAKPKPSRTAA